MSEDKYRCHQCQAEFRDLAGGYPETGSKCSMCGSADIEKLDVAGSIREFLNRLMRPGYG